MGYKSPAQIFRAVRRIPRFLENKRPALLPSIIVLPSIAIAPVYPKLSITHVQTTIVPSASETTNSRFCLNNVPEAAAQLVDPLPVEVEPVADQTQLAVTDDMKTLTHRDLITIMENSRTTFLSHHSTPLHSWTSSPSHSRGFHPDLL